MFLFFAKIHLNCMNSVWISIGKSRERKRKRMKEERKRRKRKKKKKEREKDKRKKKGEKRECKREYNKTTDLPRLFLVVRWYITATSLLL